MRFAGDVLRKHLGVFIVAFIAVPNKSSFNRNLYAPVVVIHEIVAVELTVFYVAVYSDCEILF
jgi:hypothetical protein